jgi:uncharacterized protein
MGYNRNNPMNEPLTPPPRFPLHTAIFEGGLSFVAVGVGWLLGRQPMATLSADPYAVLEGVAAVLPLLLLLILCIKWNVRGFADVLRAVEQLLVPMFRSCTLLEIAVISLLAGIGEELLFRGVLQAALKDGLLQTLGAWHGAETTVAWLAAVLVAVMFGLLHAVNASYALLAGLIGLYLGWLWMATGNLTAPITTHAVYDFLALTYFVKIRKGNDQIPMTNDQ